MSENSPSSNQSKFVRSIFVDREQELERRRHLLLIEDEQIAAITGGRGTGKTVLARAFYERFKSKFPSGIVQWNLRPESEYDIESFGLSISDAASQNTPPSLLILESHKLPKGYLDKYLDEVRTASPESKILLESRHVVQDLPIGNQINLENFTFDIMREFIDGLGISLEPEALQNVYQQVLGNPVATLALLEQSKNFQNLSDNQLTDSLTTFDKCGLVDRYGRPLDPDSDAYRTIITEVGFVNDELLQKLSANPRLLYELTPRAFEEVVAELLQRLGYQVTLTPASNDGGKDIHAAKKDVLGSFLYLIECKRYVPENRVGVELVRQLHGVVQAEKATAGILVTTSYFTKGAHEFQRNVSFQISLQDFRGIQKWLQSAVIDVT